jgi:hypothetical protein
MFLSLLVLQLIARSGGGVGVTKLHNASLDGGFSFSKHKIKTALKDLQSVGAIHRVGNVYYLCVLGLNLHNADILAADDKCVHVDMHSTSNAAYQKKLV